jgi:hypothetical protein
MSAGVLNIELEQGATKTFSAVYKTADGLAIDLTGYSGRGQVRLTTATGTTLASFTVVLVETADLDTEGNPFWQADITLPASALTGASLEGPRWNNKVTASYDIELYTAADADVIRLLNGSAFISPEVTR